MNNFITKFNTITDNSVAGIQYVGQYAIGATPSASDKVFRILRIETVGDVENISYARTNTFPDRSDAHALNKAWADRATYTYHTVS